ncbi:MAG TPA: serine/threonine-protein kinase, partial [Thermoanaerobaculia bacterium]|nr:serine/threonine-protein kinase [Thermoanaerobaculia bacterium]
MNEHEETELKPPPPSPQPSRRDSRFTPGAMVADRFRIVALLGKGGMGEVYRAEDIKLGQQVALKFLPISVAADQAKLERLYGEVRLGRQVSHPNVCRVYDVMEWNGNHFISMEYIDGEDLASLLRRIGKLPQDKALDIARDLCAGLAAAHRLGIIHRDLKPANVMIDGRGTARITDFGLAALVDDARHRGEIAGTPAYMAPEQIAGGEVTARTDLYALGLILYEVFTGKRLSGSPRSYSLSQDTKDIDPAVQRVILRCLEERVESRPQSIQAVISALPGGDPLQAAVDAGETPSPEMVAAAGESGELRPAYAWALLIATILLILLNAALSQRAMLYGRVSLPKQP